MKDVPDIDVLGTLPRTRREILLLLKQRVHATILELARELEMTHEGVRSHMQQLQRDGWVASDCPHQSFEAGEQGSGRPRVRYCLTVAGEHVFPKRYDSLTALLLGAVANMTDANGLHELLATVTDIRMNALETKGTGKTRGRALRSLYLEDDPFIETTERDGDLVIIERNCPFLQVALDHPAICSTTVSALRRLTGCEVVREYRFQDGEGRCEFRVLSRQPLANPPRFAPEPPKNLGRTSARDA